MSYLKSILSFIAVLSFCISCTDQRAEPGPSVKTDLETEVIKASDAYTQAIAEVDAEKVLSFWAEDLIIFRPDGEDFVGKQQFSAFIHNMYDGLKVKDIAINSRSVEVSGRLAVEIVEYSESLSFNDGEWTPISGRYLAVWRKEENAQWKIIKMVNLPEGGEEGHTDESEG